MATKKNPAKSGVKPSSAKAPQAASRAGLSKKPLTLKAQALRQEVSKETSKEISKEDEKKRMQDSKLAQSDKSNKDDKLDKVDKKGKSKLKDKANEKVGDQGNSVLNGKANGKHLPEAVSGPAGKIPKTEPVLEKDLVKKPAGSLKSSLRIFQIYYEPWQRELVDPNFSALDNSKSKSEALDFGVFEQLLKSEYVKDAQLWGALSWRFAELTGMSGAEWVKNIQAHPGNDVYFCNPYPAIEALYHSAWLQGETAHPQFFALSQAIFQVVGLPLEELTSLHPSDTFSSANFLVATPKFWAAYLPWVRNVLSVANKKLPPRVRDLMHSRLADKQNLHNGASYVPFIIERLFPVFMKTAGKSMKAYKIALPERERELNVHLKLLREMKDVAHRTKSAWLGVCWVNYRNLYLTQVNGKDWSKKFLRAITPADIKFS